MITYNLKHNTKVNVTVVLLICEILIQTLTKERKAWEMNLSHKMVSLKTSTQTPTTTSLQDCTPTPLFKVMNHVSKGFIVLVELQNRRCITIHCNTCYTKFIHTVILMGDRLYVTNSPKKWGMGNETFRKSWRLIVNTKVNLSVVW